jgi:predicted transcriptional regulator
MLPPNLRATIQELSSLSGSFYCLAPERLLSFSPDKPETYGNRWIPVNPLSQRSYSYSELTDTCRLLGYAHLSTLEIAERLSAEKLWQSATLVFCPDYFSSGDYGGSLVELSNLQTFLEDYKEAPGIYELYGSYGSAGLALDVRHITAEILEDLGALQSYPVRSEDHLYHLELEKEEEAWECWAERDFRSALIEEALALFSSAPEAQLESLEEALEEAESGSLAELLRSLQERSNLHWETETTSRWCDAERAAQSLQAEDLEQLLSAQPAALQLLSSLRSVSQLELLP